MELKNLKEQHNRDLNSLTVWHEYFAWSIVECNDGRRFWLDTVYRKGKTATRQRRNRAGSWESTYWIWEYKAHAGGN